MRELARLIVPVACPGCGVPDVRWCAACGAVLTGPARRVEHDVPRLDRLDGIAPLPVWSLARYEGAVRDVVVAWKDRGRADLDDLVVPAAARAAVGLRAGLAAAAGRRAVLVVPMPSSAAARRARARDHLAPLARAVSHATGAVPAPVLRRVHATDQVGLGARARGGNGQVRVQGRALARAARTRDGRGRAVALLVDDVVTTGATLAAAEHALCSAGADVLGALVLAATPSPGDTARQPAGAGQGER